MKLIIIAKKLNIARIFLVTQIITTTIGIRIGKLILKRRSCSIVAILIGRIIAI
jgi:hypothetical protein